MFEKLLAKSLIPKMVPISLDVIRGTINREKIPEILVEKLKGSQLLSLIKPKSTVAVACGSREITNFDKVIKSIVNLIKNLDCTVFIFPAMGSHGGATAEGQLEILESYNITEETIGCEIKSSMETVLIGETENGIEVNLDKNAAKADYIIPINRIKPHTDFRGNIESGIMKILAIGCGKQQGADICHSLGFENMSQNISNVANYLLKKKSIPFAVGIIEDAFHNTFALEVLPGKEIEQYESNLLKKAKNILPTLPFDNIDVLILDEIGKDISGAGMDSNIIGRSSIMGISKPYIERIAVLDLTEKSHKNGCGIGGADVTTQRFFEKMDFGMSYPNAITSHDPTSMKIPAVMPNDRTCIKLAIHTCVNYDRKIGHKVIWMKNTLSVDNFLISESLIKEIKTDMKVQILSEGEEIKFNDEGNLDYLSKPKHKYGTRTMFDI